MATLSSYRVEPGTFESLECRGCRSALDIHQPNLQQPDQFLGTCSGCHRWYRLAASPNEAGLTILELPEVEPMHPSPAAARSPDNDSRS